MYNVPQSAESPDRHRRRRSTLGKGELAGGRRHNVRLQVIVLAEVPRRDRCCFVDGDRQPTGTKARPNPTRPVRPGFVCCRAARPPHADAAAVAKLNAEACRRTLFRLRRSSPAPGIERSGRSTGRTGPVPPRSGPRA